MVTWVAGILLAMLMLIELTLCLLKFSRISHRVDFSCFYIFMFPSTTDISASMEMVNINIFHSFYTSFCLINYLISEMTQCLFTQVCFYFVFMDDNFQQSFLYAWVAPF
mgnify:CR=1 FL=1